MANYLLFTIFDYERQHNTAQHYQSTTNLDDERELETSLYQRTETSRAAGKGALLQSTKVRHSQFRSRHFPYAALDRYVLEDAQLTQIKCFYSLSTELSLRASRNEFPKSSLVHEACKCRIVHLMCTNMTVLRLYVYA